MPDEMVPGATQASDPGEPPERTESDQYPANDNWGRIRGWVRQWFDKPPKEPYTAPPFPTVTNLDAAAIAYEYLLNFVNQESEDANSRDVKLGIIFASGTGLVGLLAAALAIRSFAHAQGLIPMVLTSVPYVLVVIFSTLGLRRGWFDWGPEPSKIAQLGRRGISEFPLYAVLLAELAYAITVNEKLLERKNEAIKISFRALVVEAVAFLAAMFWAVGHA